VIAFVTALLSGDLADIAFWSRINIGSTLRGGGRTRRDNNVLLPIAAYRSGSAELAVRGGEALQTHTCT
jgi:hypothetical protein